MTRLFECYVYRPMHIEAVEIIERLIANGAKVFDSICGMGVGGKEGVYDKYDCWGYHSGSGTYTYDGYSPLASSAKRLTMPEFRAAFPCEKYDVQNDKWLPAIGEWFEVWVDTVGYWARAQAKAHIDGGVLWRNGSDRSSYQVALPDEVRPLESEREKFIEAAIEAVGGRQAVISADSVFGKLYDADFKAPK